MPPTKPDPFSHAFLKQQHRSVRNGHSEPLTLRIHRALSWLHRAEMAEDIDGRFIFLWIAFNSAYAQEIHPSEKSSEKATFLAFLEKLCALDRDQVIDRLLWKEFSGSIRTLLDNPYVNPQFWEFQRGRLSESEWKSHFVQAKRVAHAALAGSNAPVLLSVIFHHLYTLRNQLMHGGATWNGGVNRDQLRDCTSLMAKLVPVVIALMMDHPQFAMHGQRRADHHTAMRLSNGLQTKTDTEHRNKPAQLGDGIQTNAGLCRRAGAGGHDDGIGRALGHVVHAEAVIAHDIGCRSEPAQIVIKIVCKTVVIIDQ